MGISLKFGGSFGKFPSKDCGLISPKFEGFLQNLHPHLILAVGSANPTAEQFLPTWPPSWCRERTRISWYRQIIILGNFGLIIFELSLVYHREYKVACIYLKHLQQLESNRTLWALIHISDPFGFFKPQSPPLPSGTRGLHQQCSKTEMCGSRMDDPPNVHLILIGPRYSCPFMPTIQHYFNLLEYIRNISILG